MTELLIVVGFAVVILMLRKKDKADQGGTKPGAGDTTDPQ